jgi:hypothetical protein
MNKQRFLLTVKGFSCSVLFILILAGINLVSILSSSSVQAQGNLMITQTRVVFEGPKKSQELQLINTGTDTARYVVSMVQVKMLKDGAFEYITAPDSGQYFADKYLRYFPRTVTLGPKEPQVVKIQLQKADKLAPGEYRSHIEFKAISAPKARGEKDALPKDTAGVSVKLVPTFSITIPVIIRVGPSNTKVTLSNLSLKSLNDTIERFSMNFNRAGNFSSYGDVKVSYISAEGKTTLVASAKGLGVYTPNKVREFHINIKKAPGINLHSGKLKVTYTPPSDVKSGIIAEAEMLLN